MRDADLCSLHILHIRFVELAIDLLLEPFLLIAYVPMFG